MVLRTLALSVARPGCKFLEVGSWCGDSAVILGKVARETGGQLFCVDWWRGNVGTYLEDIAAKEDVFLFFWRRMCQEGLMSHVIPIRGRSDEVASALREHSFDLVFIDGDHRYIQALRDIRQFLPLVTKNGVICGHDCEGRIDDYERDFLERGKDVDYYETVHCGVVLAVGLTFQDYSINHSVWSARAGPQDGVWQPTNISIPEGSNRRQTAPPLLAHTINYHIQRYGRHVYAIPSMLAHLDIRDETTQNNDTVVKASDMQQLLRSINEPLSSKDLPRLIEGYRAFNLVDYNGKIWAMSQALGGIDLETVDSRSLTDHERRGEVVSGLSLEEAKHKVDLLLSQISILRKSFKWALKKLRAGFVFVTGLSRGVWG